MSTSLASIGIQFVGANRLIERVADVQAPDVAVAGPAEVRRANLVVRDQPDGRGTNEEAVVIVVGLAAIAAVVKAELGCIALRQEILNVEVRDSQLLPAAMELVEAAVGVLLEKVEHRARCIRDGSSANVPKMRTPGCSTTATKPRKSVLSSWMPARTDTKS